METLTVLFTDLVGSTAQRVATGEEAADEVRIRHDRLVRVAIVANNGTVAKHTGDGMMATFAGASDSIAAAVAIQQAIAADNARSLDALLHVRIGISVGDVSLEAGDCFGLPVVEAQRLENAAKPGQILISSLVKALARGRGGHEIVSIGSLTLKGLAEPLAAEEVRWTPIDSRDELTVRPPALVQHGGFAFAGRAREREVLVDAWDAAAKGSTRLVFLAGEPGIGKTRLASEFASHVLEHGGTLLAGRCDEMVSEPFQPFAEALRFTLSQPDGPARLGASPEELSRIVPELIGVFPDLALPFSATPDVERIRFFDAARSWLSDAARHSPMMLVLDDVHWADSGSLLLLRHIMATDPVENLMVVATYRDTDLDRLHPLASMLSDFHRRADAVRISLKGLDAAEVTEFVTLASGHDLDENAHRLVAALSEETGGNPFFAGEVLRHLVESGALMQRGGRWISESLTEGDLPEGVREVVGRRLSVLPESTQQLLISASVIGARFDLGLLVAIAKDDEGGVLDDLEPAITAQLVVETGIGRFQFAHALIRTTLHQELSTTRRARLHRQVAQALVSSHLGNSDSIAADLAYHFCEAGPAALSDEALRYARRAAELALERLAPDEAIRWARAAIEMLDQTDLRVHAELLGIIAGAEAAAGSAATESAQVDAARAALAAGDAELAADLIGSGNRLVATADQPAVPERVAVLEMILEQLPIGEIDRRAVAMCRLAAAVLYSGDFDRRDRILRDVEAVLPDVGPEAAVVGIAALGVPRGSIRRPAREASFARIQTIARQERADLSLSVSIEACLVAMIDANVLGDGPGMRAFSREVAEMLREYAHPLYEDIALLWSMSYALIDGDVAAAERHMVDFAQRSTRHGRPGEAELYTTVGTIGICWERDGVGALNEVAVGLMSTDPPAPAAAAVAASALANSGDQDRARALIDEHLGRGFPDVIADASWPVAVAFWADAAALIGHSEACRDMREWFVPMADLHLVTGGFYGGCAARHLACLGSVLGLDDTAHWFEIALAQHHRMQSPPWIARTHLDWAEHLARNGDAEGARGHVNSALDAIGELDLRVSTQRAEQLLAGLS